MKPSPRSLIASLVSMLLILLLNTCGIEQFIPQLNPPSNPVKSGETVSFWKTTNNSETEFIGFDLYYRMYRSQDNPDPNDIVEFQDLGVNGFRRIHASSDKEGQIEHPLIRIQPNDRTPGGSPPDNDQFKLTVDFTGVQSTLDLVDPFPKIVDDGTPTLIDPNPLPGDSSLPDPPPILIEITDIRRDVPDETSDSYKRFSEFSDGDLDITTEIWDAIEIGEAKIVLYAVSYGYDFVNFRSLRSEPVKLGEIDRDFP